MILSYVAYFFFAVILQLLLVVTTVHFIRRRKLGAEAGTWWSLCGKVLLLMVIVNAIAFLPLVGIAGGLIWIIAMKRLSGLDILSTLLLSTLLGIICLAIALTVAYQLRISLAGQSFGA